MEEITQRYVTQYGAQECVPALSEVFIAVRSLDGELISKLRLKEYLLCLFRFLEDELRKKLEVLQPKMKPQVFPFDPVSSKEATLWLKKCCV